MRKVWGIISLLALVGLVACSGPTPESVTEVVKETVVVESVVKETVVVEKEVVTEKEVEVVVTATSIPAQQGGVFIEASSTDASLLNPIVYSDSASFDVIQHIFPALVNQDPVTGEVIPDLAESWEVSEDGLTWTFHLQEGLTWSDGDPLDAADFKYTYEAIASDKVDSPRKYITDGIKSIETPDPQTVIVTFNEIRCDGLLNLGLGLLPSHLFAEDFSDVMESPLNEAPSVSAGPLLFKSWARDDNVVLERNTNYYKGAPYIDGWIYKVVPDPGARLGQLQSGEVDYIEAQPEQLTTVELDPNLNLYKFKDDGYSYIAMNLGNPENPQPGQDEEGNLIEQDPHPILGDINVRKAIAHSLDYDTIINKVYLGQGYRLAANVLPAIEWAYNNDLQPYEYNQELAAQLLEEAGWVDEDGDGVREKDGRPLALNLATNAGNTTREDLGVLVQDQLNSIGFDITFEAIEFGTLIEDLDNQTFDMIIIGWTGLGPDPNDDAFWHTQFDVPGSGFNAVSYHNPEVDKLLEEGVSVVGCSTEERGPIYKQIQEIIHGDVPYIFVSGTVGNTAYTSKWQSIDPGPWLFYHNIEQFSLAQ